MEKKVRKKRRKKSEIESIINKAAIHLIEEGGFPNVTVRKIAEEANIEAVVFYNRYKDSNEFISEFVKKYDYWFGDVNKEFEGKGSCKEQYISTLTSLFDSLQENKVMQGLLKWEVSNNNNITQQTAALRELHTIPVVEKYKKYFENSSVKIDSISALIVGGIYYLILHSEVSNFGGIDVNTEDGKEKIRNAIEYLGDILFAEKSCDLKILTMAKKMKEKGMEVTSIAEYTDLPIDMIINL